MPQLGEVPVAGWGAFENGVSRVLDTVAWNHEEALRDREGAQNVLTKFVIPVSERAAFLRKLESINIHTYSLFRDETALMQMLAYREIEKREG